MASEKSGFRSRSDYQRDEFLCERYGRIGIPAVAAAQSAMHHCDAGKDRVLRTAAKSDERLR